MSASGNTSEAEQEAREWALLMEKDYHHPYIPYHVQKQFMSTVFRCLDEGKVGVLESPTGTGKSLSLICGSLTWLREWKRRAFEENLAAGGEDADDEPDWMVASAREQKRKLLLQNRAEREAKLTRIREKEEKARLRFEKGEPVRKRQRTDENSTHGRDDEDEFLLDDYYSDDENGAQTRASSSAYKGLSASTQALLAKLGDVPSKVQTDNEDEAADELKIFYCSRTHSQISQFVNELQRVKLPPSVPPDTDIVLSSASNEADPASISAETEELKHLTLGSRNNLCINPKVAKPGASTTSINERCLELQQPSTPKDKRCPYLPNKDNEVLVNDFRDHALAKIRDIEDFGKLGKRIGICPYYASRAAVKPAEIITLPYPLLLQKSAREALDISLKGHIVIIDEAHNLLDAISNIHSSTISLSQLKLGRAQLGGYLLKFRNRLKGKNRVYATQLLRLIDSLKVFSEGKTGATLGAGGEEGKVVVGELTKGKGVDQINLYKLMRYLQESKIARKVERYALFEAEQTSASAQPGKSKGSVGQQVRLNNDQQDPRPPMHGTGMPVLTHLQSFLLALTYPAAEGRFFYERLENEDVMLKYLLLDATHHFREIVDEARAVILAGGTMSPMTDYTTNLLPYLPPSRLVTLSCPHVIPPTNLLAMPVGEGPSGIPFEFTFAKRSDQRMIRELGESLVELSELVPDGLVVFFPSYGYLDSILKVWKEEKKKVPGGKEIEELTIWQQLEKRKKLFMEPKSSSSTTTASTSIESSHDSNTSTTSSKNSTDTNNKLDALLHAYSTHIHTRPPINTKSRVNDQPAGYNGALLLAVINGSLSEGINFSDRLGRCVVVVGLPFPNASSAAWKAKLEYVGARAVAVATEASEQIGASEASVTPSIAPPAPTHLKQVVPAGDHRYIKAIADGASRAHYTNACMRSINQSIGRAIRHANDYGAILLFDSRWEKKEGGRGEELRGLLPGWIRESLVLVNEAQRDRSGQGDGGARRTGDRSVRWRNVTEHVEEFFGG